MADRATVSMAEFEKSMQSAPETFLIDYDRQGKAKDLVPMARGIDGNFARPDFAFPPMQGFRNQDGVYITNGAADVNDVHPIILDSSGYKDVSSGTLVVMDGVEVIQPKYDMVAIQDYVTSNAWHYAAVKAKAIAATELGYEWVYAKKGQRGVVTATTRELSKLEDRIYERNHKDLATILREQAMDYFATGNKAMEIAYNMGGKVDCIYSVPAITLFRHPFLPVAVQALPEHEKWSSILPFSPGERKHGLEVKAIMPLFMSGIYRKDLIKYFPDVNQDIMSNNEIVHVTNSLISTDPFYGVADIIPALAALFGDNAANDYNWQFFENNAIPRYAVTISGGRVSERVKSEVRDFFNREIQGRAHRTIIIPLPRDMTAQFQALDATQNDASFLNFKRFTREEIAAVHSVPPSEIGLWESANKANSSQQSKNYFLKVIRPYQAKDEAMMNRLIRYGLGLDGVQFRFKNVEYTDDLERAQVNYTKTQAYRQYMDALNNTLKTLQALVNGQVSGGMGTSSNWGGSRRWSTPGDQKPINELKLEETNASSSSSNSGSGSTSTANAATKIQIPLLTKDEVQDLVFELLNQIMEGRKMFELEELVDRWD